MSFFASLLEGTANAGAKSLENFQRRQYQLEDDERTDARALERYRQQRQIDAESAEQLRQASQARLAQQMDEARKGGEALNAVERMRQLTAAGAGDVESITPEQEAMMAQGRGLDYDAPLAKIGYQEQAARNAGAFDAMAVLEQDRKNTVAALQQRFNQRMEAVKEEQANRRMDQTDTRIANEAKARDQQHQASMARVDAMERRGSEDKRASDYEKLTTQQSVLRGRLSDERKSGSPEDSDEIIQIKSDLAQVESLLRNRRAPLVDKAQGDKGAAKQSQPTAGELVYDPKTKKFTPAK